jgi:hypothetical protein
MTRNLGADRLHLAQTLCRALAEAGTPVQLRGIRQEAYETHYVLSPGSGLSVQNILAQACLIKRTVNQRHTRVRREDDDILVVVTHDFELMVILNYLIPLCVPSLLVINVAALDRGLRLLFNGAPDVLGAVIFVLAVVVLDVCLATQVPHLRRRSRAPIDRNDRKR